MPRWSPVCNASPSRGTQTFSTVVSRRAMGRRRPAERTVSGLRLSWDGVDSL
jgi:hypothetical protein